MISENKATEQSISLVTLINKTYEILFNLYQRPVVLVFLQIGK